MKNKIREILENVDIDEHNVCIESKSLNQAHQAILSEMKKMVEKLISEKGGKEWTQKNSF